MQHLHYVFPAQSVTVTQIFAHMSSGTVSYAPLLNMPLPQRPVVTFNLVVGGAAPVAAATQARRSWLQLLRPQRRRIGC